MDDLSAADANKETLELSTLEGDKLYSTLKAQFKADMDHSNEWRTTAKEEFGFVAGDQWKAEDRAALEEQKRPVIVFNRALSIIKAIAGIEINGRHDTVYLPRGTTPGAVKANEILTSASQWMADGTDAEDEQSEAFQDTIICGMGWTEQRISYDEEPDGAYVETKIDPLEMYWDCSARGKNLHDARRVFRVRKMSVAEARDFAQGLAGPDFMDDDLDATWATGAETEAGKSVEERRLRDENSSFTGDRGYVHIVHAQWIEKKPFYRTGIRIPGQMDVQTGQMQPDQNVEKEFDEQSFKQFEQLAREQGLEYKYVRQTRKVYKHAFLGKTIIGKVMDCPGKDRFTYQCITGEKDRNKGTWFGLVRLMRDPQMWANKWLSQTLHILNTTAKGGILAEKDAFDDIREAQDTYARPDAITFTKAGAVSNGKIMQKPGTGLPTGYVNLLEFAIASIRDVTGINLELLGMRDANQPGILEAQRKQAAMTILATMFDSLRRFRKNVGRVRLNFIQQYLADGRLIRIAGEDGMQAVPLLKDKTIGDYEVIIEDAPTSPNQKQETWGMLMQILPVFKDMMTPEAAIAVLEYSPLPSKLVDQFKAMAQKPNPDADAEKEIAKAGAIAKVEKDKAAAFGSHAQGILDLAKAATAGAEATMARTQAAIVSGGSLPPLNGIEEPYAVPPQGSAGPMPQMTPPTPVIPGAPAPQEVV